MYWERGRQRHGRHRTRRARGAGMRRAGATLFGIGGVILAGTAVGSGSLERLWAAAAPDERFVAAAADRGLSLPQDPPDPLVVRAAQKLCERRAGADTSAKLRQTALTPEEIAAVRRTFGDDTEAFLAMSLRIYCPLDR